MADGGSGSVYPYQPNKGAAIFFTVAFGATGLLHLWQSWYYKLWRLTSHLLFCGLLMVAGFVARSYSAFHNGNGEAYTATLLLIYASPPFLGVTNYLILARLFLFVPYCAPMHPNRMVAFVSTLTALIVVLSLVGIGYLTDRNSPERSVNIGDTLTKVSIVLQIVVGGLFFLVAGLFHSSCLQRRISNTRVMRPLYAAYASMFFFLGRNIYRMIVHFGIPVLKHEMNNSSLVIVVRYEWYFMVFEATLIFLSLAVWNVAHPGRFLPPDSRKYLAQNNRTILDGPGWKDSRTITELFFDPFNMFHASDGNERKFWEHNGYHRR
ncbi:hypothetical protein C7999DRAFT_41773 [Corynascus novoguineensis]|uniref:RTA1 domain protein n=1 Tax=Corynascus novoguineensis TaxID=1126955 RepID=A0AAN7CRV5_9PEZI|nr:hypothetical protein C7999DRAFT_41773 [Corynascus novoguineensis]